MTESLVATGLSGGVYTGLLSGPGATRIEAVFRGEVVATAEPEPDPARDGLWRVTLSLPAEVLSDGVQVVALRSSMSGEVLDRVTVLAGEALAEDLAAELALLRDEVELLKAAFRRHVVAGHDGE